MKPIKIYGESKTGTTYLEHLIRKNTDAEVLVCSDWGPLGWKHGFPQAGDALYIFIFRNVYEWVKSLKADSIDKRFNGLQQPFGNIDTRNYQDHWKTWNNPIECRTAKYYSYLGFAQMYDCTFLINYEHLRESPHDIIDGLDFLGYRDLSTKDLFTDIPNHTYKKIEGRDNPDREELTKSEIAFIDSKIDPKLESFVDNLTIQ